jgi:hypothetical protein
MANVEEVIAPKISLFFLLCHGSFLCLILLSMNLESETIFSLLRDIA